MNPTTDAVQEANPQAEQPDIQKAFEYLSHFGYLAGAVLSGAVSPMLAVTSLATAVTDFQRMAGIPETGEVDTKTMEVMSRPRCGCLDVQRMVVEEARWRKNRLKYHIQNYVNGISHSDQDDLLALAWKHWSDVCDIHPEAQNSPSGADILISTGESRTDGFDGPSGTLAWAYLPQGNDAQLLMRFDLSESWAKDSGGGVLMLNVACHEFGHLLGLEHSRTSSALMAPFYSPGVSKPRPVDDISRIQSLYGAAVGQPQQPPSPPKRVLIQFEVESLTAVSIPGYRVVRAV